MNKKLISVFEWLNILFMGTILVVSVTGTYHHIAWYKVSFVSVIWFICFLVTFLVFKKSEAFLTKHKTLLLGGYLFLLFSALSAASILFANPPTNDYGEVYESSLNLIAGKEVNWSYYAMFKNNYLLLLLMALIRLPAYLAGFNGTYSIIIFSVLCATTTALLIFKIMEHFRFPIYLCFLSLVIYALFLPLYGCTYAFYSDQATIMLTVLPIYLIVSDSGDNKWLSVIKIILVGLFACMAFWLKATALIPIIAFTIVKLLTSFNRRTLFRILTYFCAFICFWIIYELIWRASPAYKMTDMHVPIIHWIALGSHGHGDWDDNADYAYELLATPTIEAKKEFAYSYLRRNLNEMFSVTHIVSKMRHNFAAGFMGLSTYIYEPDSPAFPFLSAYGTYGGYTMMLATGMYYLLLLLNILGSVISIIRQRTDNQNILGLFARISLFGLFLFLMFWEANNRQLYNHIPLLVLSGAATFAQFFDKPANASRSHHPGVAALSNSSSS